MRIKQRLLKALGYLNALDNGAGVEERIQMHADKLYHQMLDQEKAEAQAKAEGKAIPKFEPVIPNQAVKDATAAEESNVSAMTEAAKKRVQDKLKAMDKMSRQAEEAAIEGEVRSRNAMVTKIKEMWKEQEAEREERQAKGEGTLWDKATSLWKGSGSSGGKS